MPSKIRIFMNAAALYIENLLNIIVGIISVYFLSRYFGPDKFGQFNFIVSYVVMFYMMSEFGLTQIVVREIAKNPSRRDDLLGAGMIIKLVLSAVSLVLACLFYVVLKYDTMLFWGFLIYSLKLVFSFMSLSISVYRVSFRNHIGSLINLSCRFLYLLLLLISIHFKLSLNYFFLILAMSEILMDIIRNLILRNEVKYKIRFDFPLIKSLLIESLPLALSVILITIYTKINIMILTKMSNFNQVGIYSAAERIVQLVNFVPLNVSIVLFPLFSMYSFADPQKSIRILQKTFLYLGISGFIISTLMYISSSSFIPILYGKKFGGTVGLMQIFSIQSFFTFMGIPLGSYLISIGKQNVNLLNDALGAVLNISLCFILIPIDGAIGATNAAIITKVFLSIFMIIYFEYFLKVHLPIIFILKSVLIFLCLYFFAHKFNLLSNLFYLISLFIVYTFILLKFKLVNMEDFNFLKQELNKDKK